MSEEEDPGEESEGEVVWYDDIENVPPNCTVKVFYQKDGKKLPFKVKKGESSEEVIKLSEKGPLGQSIVQMKGTGQTLSLLPNKSSLNFKRSLLFRSSR